MGAAKAQISGVCEFLPAIAWILGLWRTGGLMLIGMAAP